VEGSNRKPEEMSGEIVNWIQESIREARQR
jgi:hypothetical protein